MASVLDEPTTSEMSDASGDLLPVLPAGPRAYASLGAVSPVPAPLPRPANPAPSHKDSKCFSPESAWTRRWNALVFLALIYNFTSTLLLMAFDPSFPQAYAYVALCIAADIVYLADSLFRSRLGFVQDGEIVLEQDAVWRNYRASDMVVDVLSLAPVDWVFVRFQALFGAVRLIRLLRLSRLLRIIDDWLEHSSRPQAFRLVKLSLLPMAAVHSVGCVMLAGLRTHQLTGRIVLFPSLINPAAQSAPLTYGLGLFWAFSLMTGLGPEHGVPGSWLELAFMMATLAVGMFLFAIVIGYIAELFAAVNAHRQRFRLQVRTSARVPPCDAFIQAGYRVHTYACGCMCGQLTHACGCSRGALVES